MIVADRPARPSPRRGTARLTRVARGVHRLSHAGVNCYLLEEAGRVTVVDAGLPRTWVPMRRALLALGRSVDDVEAVVLTHAHFDHLGFADRMHRLGIPVFAHELDHGIALHPRRYAHERARLPYPLRFPAARPVLGSMLAAGALQVRGVRRLERLVPGTELALPGTPRVLFAPGHTLGSCAFHLPERDVLLTGDALVTLDPYTGRRGPRIVAGAATADSALNLRSLEVLAATGAAVVAPGHGEVWRDGVRQAVDRALRAGTA